VREWLMGFSMWKSSIASSPLPRRATAITVHTAACVYWPAVLAHARGIAADVAGILGGGVERRREEQHHPDAAPHEVGPHASMARSPEAEGHRAGEDGPGLRDRVDLALVVLRGAERRAVVVVAAAVPSPVPAQLQRAGQAPGLARDSARRARRRRASRTGPRSRPGSRAGRTRARCSRRGRGGPRGSSRRSSPRSP
jgi:hypothetical protein